MDKFIFLKNSKLKREYENLFQSLKNVKNALKENKPEKVPEFLNQFMFFLVDYFNKEENLMKEFKYPDLEFHKRDHQLINKKLEYFFVKSDIQRLDLSCELIELLENLLIDHVNTFDKTFNLYLNIKIDSLTEFLSKEAFFDTLQDFINKAKEKLIEDIALIVLEIEDYSLLSLTLGAEITDLLLKDFSLFLREYFHKPNIIFGKYKENQILIILLNYNFLEIIEFLEDLVDKVKNFKFKTSNQTIHLNISIGVALYPHDGDEAFKLLKSAEIALQIAKREGRNKWVFFDSKFLKELEKLNRIKTLLERAIRERLVIPYIQPIFDTHNLTIIGGEVLIRILDEKKNIISAGTFIKHAYELGYIEDLEALLTEEINKDEILKLFKNKYIFINKSVNSYNKAFFVSEELKLWKEIAKTHEIFSIFEITESSIINFLDVFQIISSETKTERIGIAIDDFGSGYASFTSLLKVDPKFLKIDGNLIRQINKSKKCYNIVKGIVSIAKDLGIKTIAEFVENREIAEALKNLNVDLFQSFYFCKPLSVEEFKNLIS
uniref:EAL domain-containing protein n=1 Tax=Thermodesulfobacterium geofontis TaxID=1295609 RepID=A0A7V4N3I9_9BACT